MKVLHWQMEFVEINLLQAAETQLQTGIPEVIKIGLKKLKTVLRMHDNHSPLTTKQSVMK